MALASRAAETYPTLAVASARVFLLVAVIARAMVALPVTLTYACLSLSTCIAACSSKWPRWIDLQSLYMLLLVGIVEGGEEMTSYGLLSL